jgi:hypothetical protein
LPTMSPTNSGIMAPQPCRRRGVSGFPTCERYALIPNSLNLLRRVWALYTAVICSWRRYGSFHSCSCPIGEMRKSHKASCLVVVTRGWPLRGRSLVFPNCTRRPCRRWRVVWWTPRAVATPCWVAPWRSIVTARLLHSSFLKRGIRQHHF